MIHHPSTAILARITPGQAVQWLPETHCAEVVETVEQEEWVTWFGQWMRARGLWPGMQ